MKYKITAPPTTSAGIRPRPWDWFYGPGYWWFAYDYNWYPGFSSWGCLRPVAVLVPAVLCAAGGGGRPRGGDRAGRHGEGRDRHRRGQGPPSRPGPQLLRSPPKWWTRRGGRSSARATSWWPGSRSASRPGSIAAITGWATWSRRTSPPGRSTASRSRGKGQLALLQISYKDGKPVETEVFRADVPTNEEGVGSRCRSRPPRLGNIASPTS